MIIPPDRLPAQTLESLLEEFITREGTDYGLQELSLEAKRHRLQQQLSQGQAIIWFDTATESTQIMTQEQYQVFTQSNADTFEQ